MTDQMVTGNRHDGHHGMTDQMVTGNRHDGHQGRQIKWLQVTDMMAIMV
jgi:hypothetical protein